MTRIRVLPELLSNRIAAGEVVERPASVVKELVENALDADSLKVLVEIGQGGRSLIRVSDNGTGMGHDDALLALERYGTSKLYDDAGLSQINTLGFRGEALPSIASVSRFTLVTRERRDLSGTQIDVEGGKVTHVTETGAPPGTMVSVKQLFYNTPARRKFLKTVRTEMSHIADTMSRIALSRPKVQFRLLHNGTVVKSWSPVMDSAARVAEVLGADAGSSLKHIVHSSQEVSVTGWLTPPRMSRSTARGISIFVNGRYVNDRVVQHALFEGYRGRLMKGRYPVAVLCVDVPPDRVDVNVHPTKHEVRFLDQDTVHRTVEGLVSDGLGQIRRISWSPALRASPRVAVRMSESVAPFGSERRPMAIRKEPAAATREEEPGSREADTVPGQGRLWEQPLFSGLHVIGQLQHTYILCESTDGLILVDQHAAHERILLEQLQDRTSGAAGPSQSLLVPEMIDVGYREADALNRLLPELQRHGLFIDPFGGNTFAVKSVPSFLSEKEIKPLLLEMVEETLSVGSLSSSGLEMALGRCLNLIACHGAIRAHQSLNDQEMKHLLSQLGRCRNASQCPHGRPVWIQWSYRFLEKSFGRTV